MPVNDKSASGMVSMRTQVLTEGSEETECEACAFCRFCEWTSVCVGVAVNPFPVLNLMA